MLLTLLHGGVGDLVGLLRALPDGVVDGGLVLQEVGADHAVVDHGGALQRRHAVQQERALREEGNKPFTGVKSDVAEVTSKTDFVLQVL